MAAALADHLGELVLRIAEPLHQLAITARFLDRVEVRPLHVLDNRDLERVLVGKIPDDRRQLVQLSQLRSPPTPLAGDDLITPACRIGPHHDRLHHALLPDGLGKLGQILLAEILARVEPPRAHQVDRQDPLLTFRRQFRLHLLRTLIADQRCKPPSKPALLQWLHSFAFS